MPIRHPRQPMLPITNLRNMDNETKTNQITHFFEGKPVVEKTVTHLSVFEKYLALWVFLCMIAGLFLSQVFPQLSVAINNLQFAGISIPIGVCLFLMMYPALLNLQLSELKKLAKNPKPILITIISNWIWAPLVTAFLAYYFLAGNDQLIVSLILLGSSPCTAMVLVWGALAKGNQEQNVVNTTLNTITIMFLYAPVVSLLTGIQNIQIDRLTLLLSVFVFIGIPMVLGYISKKVITKRKGTKWFQETYRPRVGKIAIMALLATLIVMFSLNGNVLIEHPIEMVLVSVPLLLGFFIIVGLNLLVTKFAGLRYKEGIISVIIGSSSHFEIAIATAISLYGLGSQAALGTTMGLFWEVPIMLSLVYLGKKLNQRGFWKKD
ncbi:MAG: arsenical-resistance protein [Candidatus Bathyarchaeum sp.]|nr:MAG: arsenical-resistance protein [Candidatus Bathyarchaeum sp.]